MSKTETVQLFLKITIQLEKLEKLLEQSQVDRKEVMSCQQEMLNGLKMLMRNQSTMWSKIKQLDG